MDDASAGRQGSHSRRAFLAGTAAGIVGGGALGWFARDYRQLPALAQAPIVPATEGGGLPGRYPGKVVEVNHPGAVGPSKNSDGYSERNRPAVKQMLDRGMCALVGCEHPVDAWRTFFNIGDRVGIKVVPVGKPDSISSYEVVLEVIEGLRSAGVRLSDILVCERYRSEFVQCHYDKILPDGVHWECAGAGYSATQLEIDGQTEGKPNEDHVAGYDRDVYRELAFCAPEHDPKDDRRFRSHLTTIVTRKVDKLIGIPVLKDHRSAGVTLALKNLSHGLVNNVARSHITHPKAAQRGTNFEGSTLNQCGEFIPAMVSLPPTRAKAVLQILDGLVGTWEGGPGNWNKTYATWNYQSLFFATDPVALDHIGWKIIDAKRAQEGWPRVAAMGLDASTNVKTKSDERYPEQFHIRQPQHIPLAASLGLGIFDREEIHHQRIDLT